MGPANYSALGAPVNLTIKGNYYHKGCCFWHYY